MPYQLDMTAAIEGVLTDPDLQREAKDPDRLKRELLRRTRIMRSELAGQVRAFDEAEQAVEDRLEKFEPSSVWFQNSYVYTLTLAVVLGVILAARQLGLPLPAFVTKALDVASGSTESRALLAMGALAILQVAVQLYLRRRKARFEDLRANDGTLKAMELRLTNASSEIEYQVNEIIFRNAREIVNAAQSPFLQDKLILSVNTPITAKEKISSFSGLTEVADPINEVDTADRAKLMQLIEAQPGASIGISGPRGSGKSTLLRALTAGNLELGNRRAITVYSAAPVDYDARDFLLHLFASLCRRVLITRGISDDRRKTIALARERRDAAARRPRTFGNIGVVLFMGGGTALAIGLAVAFLISRNPTPFTAALDLKPGNLVLFGGVAAVLGIFMAQIETMATRMERSRRNASVAGLAPAEQADATIVRSLEELEEIHFQRSFTSGWSGAIKVPVGFDLSTSGSVSLAQRQESLPELVDRFRRYVEDLAQDDCAVVIAIDELDKIKKPEEAEEFVNEIKSIFGIAGCYYLISVSEDAMSSFERRGLALRDAFDSAFDDIRYLGYANLDGARRIFLRRVLNFPDPFLCLCYVLSGGLPRDLIRIARTMFQVADGDGPKTFEAVAAAMVRLEVEAKVRASNTAARAVAVEPETGAFLNGLAELEGLGEMAALSGAAAKLAIAARSSTGGERLDPDAPLLTKLVAIQRELSAYLEFLDLVLDLVRLIGTAGGWTAATGNGCVDQLARARQGLEINVGSGLSRLGHFRTTLAGPDLATPQPAPPPPAPAPATPPPKAKRRRQPKKGAPRPS